MRGLRAAWAALCATILVCGGVHVAIGQALAFAYELKPRFVYVPENVAILDFTPSIDARSARLQPGLFPVIELGDWDIHDVLASRSQWLDPKWSVAGDVGQLLTQRPLLATC